MFGLFKKRVIFLDFDGVFIGPKYENPVKIENWEINHHNLYFLDYLYNTYKKHIKFIWVSELGDSVNKVNKFIKIKPFKNIYNSSLGKKLSIFTYIREHKLNVYNNHTTIVTSDDTIDDFVYFTFYIDPTVGLNDMTRETIENWCRNLVMEEL